MLLLGVAAAVTLLLSAIGLYSSVAYAVAGRANEFAVRLTLGASSSQIRRTIFRDGIAVVGVGAATGLGLAFVSARCLRGVLYNVSATDASMYLVAVLAVSLTAAVAMVVPAHSVRDGDAALVLREV